MQYSGRACIGAALGACKFEPANRPHPCPIATLNPPALVSQQSRPDIPDAIEVASIEAQRPTKLAKTPEEMRRERERMRDVQLLVQNLVLQEETTIKLIIDCLYDVGSVNLLNTKVSWGPANRLVKLAARTSKPVFRIVAWRWFKGNCPALITNWLASKVS